MQLITFQHDFEAYIPPKKELAGVRFTFQWQSNYFNNEIIG